MALLHKVVADQTSSSYLSRIQSVATRFNSIESIIS